MASPETRLVLQVADMNYRKMVGLFASSMSFGMYLIVFSMSMAVLHTRTTGPLSGRGIYWLLIILGLIATISFSCNVSTVFVDASWSRLGAPEDPFKAKLMLARSARAIPGLIYSLTSPLIFVIADNVAVWRAYVLWSHSRWVKGLLIVVALINILFWATNTVFRAVAGTPAILTGGNETLVMFSIIQLLLSTGVNAVSSALFGIRAWKHQAWLKQMATTITSSEPLKVLLVVTEGGFVLCVLQLTSSLIAVGLLVTPIDSLDVLAPISLAQIVTDTITDNFAAAYPSLVVVIIAFKALSTDQNSSKTHNIGSLSGPGGQHLTTLRFATTTSSESSEHLPTSYDVEGQGWDYKSSKQETVPF